MKSKIEVREYAVNKAAEIMGKGTPTDSLITKAHAESLVDGLKSIIGGVNDIAAPLYAAK